MDWLQCTSKKRKLVQGRKLLGLFSLHSLNSLKDLHFAMTIMSQECK